MRCLCEERSKVWRRVRGESRDPCILIKMGTCQETCLGGNNREVSTSCDVIALGLHAISCCSSPPCRASPVGRVEELARTHAQHAIGATMAASNQKPPSHCLIPAKELRRLNSCGKAAKAGPRDLDRRRGDRRGLGDGARSQARAPAGCTWARRSSRRSGTAASCRQMVLGPLMVAA